MKCLLIVFLVFLASSCNDNDENKEAQRSAEQNSGSAAVATTDGMTASLTEDKFVPAADEVSEEFGNDANSPPFDVLLTIDNSTHTSTISQLISTKAPALLRKVYHLDWKLVVTTPKESDCLRLVLQKSTTNFGDMFLSTIQQILGEQDDEKERPLHVAKRALAGELSLRSENSCSGENNVSWLRENSILVAFMPMDTVPTNEERDTFYQQIKTQHVPHVSAKLYSIIYSDGSNESAWDSFLTWTDAQTEAKLFDEYMTFSGNDEELGALSTSLDALSNNIYEQVMRTTILQHVPQNLRVVVTHKDGSRNLLADDEFTLIGKTLYVTKDLVLDNIGSFKAIYQ